MTAAPSQQHPWSKARLAEARSRSYRLLGRLYLRGLSTETLPVVRTIPALVQALPGDLDEDELAAAHQHLFGFNVFPFESLFLDSAGLLGGPVTMAVQGRYEQVGFVPAADSASIDHVGLELALLAFLAGAEADAWADGLTDTAQAIDARQRTFLADHLLRWLAPLTVAVRAQEQPFYAAVADLALDLALDQLNGPLPDFDLPAAPHLLEDERTGLKEIATFLLTPPHSGVYLSRDDIGRLGRRQRLPRGFGDRRSMLLNLLRAAVTYERLPALLVDMQALVSDWHSAYATVPGADVWGRRAAATGAFLAELTEQAQALALTAE